MKFIASDIIEKYDNVMHAFLTRVGGVSAGRFASLNFNDREGDSHSNISQNLKIAGGFLGFAPESLVIAHQVHEGNLLVIDKPMMRPSGKIEADGIVTDQEGVTIGVLTADCLPIVLFDPSRKVAGIVHAGWRGTAAGICRNAVNILTERFSSKAEDILAALGPSIGPCCYEVGEEVAARFIPMESTGHGFIAWLGNERWALDLRRANVEQLLECGVSRKRISISDYCTSCNTDLFFSVRKEGNPTGRLMNLVCMKEE